MVRFCYKLRVSGVSQVRVNYNTIFLYIAILLYERYMGYLHSKHIFRQYGNSTVQRIIASKISLYSASRGSYSSSHSTHGDDIRSGIIGWSHSDELVPPLGSAWLSDVVLPTIIVGIIVIISLFAVIVLIMLRRHIHLEGNGRHEYSIHHGPYLGMIVCHQSSYWLW